MRKFKGGGDTPTSSTVYSTSLPDYVQPAFERLIKRGEAESLQGYTPYGGQRLEYFSPEERTAQAMARGYGTAGTPQAYTDALTRYGAQGAYGASGYTQGDVRSGYTAGQDPSGYGGANLKSGYRAGAFDPGYAAQTRASQYQAGTIDPLSYEKNIQRFMSPYQQNVIDIEKREAKRQADIAARQLQDRASASGGLGGFREAIMQSEGQRNRAQLQADIQTRGSQAAYESAQRQLGAERQFGIQRFGAEQKALQSQEQFAQQAFNAGEAAKQQAAAMGMTAQQQEEAAKQAKEKFSQSAFAQTQQAMQAAGTQSIQAYQAGENARAEAARLGLSAEQIEQAGKQAEEKYSQSAFDLSSRYNQLAAQGLLATGQATQKDAISRMSLLESVGKQVRALRQAGLDIGYEDFLRQQGWSERQLGLFTKILRGIPVEPGQTVSTYAQRPGTMQTLFGAGTTALGLSKALGVG